MCPAGKLGPGERMIVETEDYVIVVFNCEGEILAIEDRCSHDDGPLSEGELDQKDCRIECPRHGSVFDLKSGKPLNLPAFEPVEIFPVEIIDDTITVKVED
ncbi:MAG: non-heme iron oxygenase ferredoxin subunit [Solirubrobacterales bacterium]|nr:non-heme iron oxygenase ferredoxin subunit [Solirubrobacterales bacterium]